MDKDKILNVVEKVADGADALAKGAVAILTLVAIFSKNKK